MEIILQSKDEYKKIAVFDTSSGIFSIFSKTNRQDLLKAHINGYFGYMDNHLVCFFRLNQDLILKVNDQSIVLDDNNMVLLESIDENRYLFKIQRSKEIILSLTYNRPPITPPIGAYQFFSPVSEEDFDILLLIYNICNNPERKKRALCVKTLK